ncbi:uncharacterized protein clos [Venturia canescens]|uniref:uncharacterized protein clos n=1 Tax=Venturia canescens TaxID=32260 RepID=UPI001C9CEAA6|nr:uncharacterized protein LOC122406154 [Venturia canescens]
MRHPFRSTMSARLLFILVLTFSFRTICTTPDQNLLRALESTTRFFDHLRLEYEYQSPTRDLYKSIDHRISEYVNRLKKSSNLSREKRQLDTDKDVRVLSGFERTPGLDFSDAIDVTFFVYRNERGPPRWYAAALNSSGISLFLYEPTRAFTRIGFSGVEHGTRITSQSSSIATIFLVQRSTGDTHVFRMRQGPAKKIVERVQTVKTPNATDLTLWQGMKKTYLAISSSKRIAVFAWVGEYFDEIQTLHIGAKRVVAFQTTGAMHLLALDQSRTSLFKFLLHTREFVLSQRFSGANDATKFSREDGHQGEYFLALARDDSTLIYKQSKHRFVPFQGISGAHKITAFYNQAAILLFLVRNNSLNVLQYDGWKFAELGVRTSGIFDIRPLDLSNGRLLAVKVRGSGDSGTNEGGIFKNNTKSSWNLLKFVWARKESETSLREKTKLWCTDSLNSLIPATVDLPQLKLPLRIEQGSIQILHARKINGESVEKFVKATRRWGELHSEVLMQEKSSKNYISRVNPILKSIDASNIRISCTGVCRAKNTITVEKETFMDKVRWLNNDKQNLSFETVRILSSKNLPCPVAAPKIKDVTVDGYVNGISFPNFAEDVLKVTGDQIFTGSPTFAELRVRNAKILLDIASDFTRQEIEALSIETDELEVAPGGFLLPLNSEPGTVMTGSLTVSDARIKGVVDSRGKINGTVGTKFSRIINVPEALEIPGNITLNNVTVLEDFRVEDIKRKEGKSYKDIISKAVPLNAPRVGVRLELRNNKVSWNNMTVHNFPYKWLTKNHLGHSLITGHKTATRSEITLGNLVHENLPTPRLPLRVCGVAAISEGVWESNLVVDKGTAKSVRAINLFSGSELSEIYLDSVPTIEEMPWALKNLTGQIKVKEAEIDYVRGVEFQELKNTLSKWSEPTRLKGPIRFTNLKTHELMTSGKFNVPLPLEIQNLQSRGNLYVSILNDVKIDEFLRDSVKLDDNLSLTNVTFAGGLEARELYATKTSFSLQENMPRYLGSKEILGSFEAEAMEVPNLLNIPSSGIPINIIVDGNVQFMKEPKITNINNKNLDELFSEVLLTDRPFRISAEFVLFKNVTFENDLTILQSFDTPDLGPWFDLENRLLSKTKPQMINVEASFASVAAPKIVASSKSHLRSNVSWLHDLEYNSLKINEPQVSANKWNFEELIITGDYEFRDQINGLNFATDVVRKDARENIVRGKKIIRHLEAQSMNGLKFDKFARKTLKKNNGNETIVVKGWKTFKTVEMKNLRVEGTVNGKKVENSLQKSANQILQGTKVLNGCTRASTIVTEGLVNGIRLNSFVEQQLKKKSPLQIIKTPISLNNKLTISGNVTIKGLYNGIELRNFGDVTRSLGSTNETLAKLIVFAEGIENAIDSRAFYWDNLELVETNSKALNFDLTNEEQIYFVDLGNCGIVDFSLYCDRASIFQPVLVIPNDSRVLAARVIDFSGLPLVVFVTSDPGGGVFIFRYDPTGRSFYKFAALLVPGIIEGSFTTTINPLWIALRLRDHLMIIRYEIRSNFEEWTIPGGGPFLMSSTPSDEFFIFRNDGVWKLGGLGGPRKILDSKFHGQIDTFTIGNDYYVQLTDKNATNLLRARFIGN